MRDLLYISDTLYHQEVVGHAAPSQYKNQWETMEVRRKREEKKEGKKDRIFLLTTRDSNMFTIC